MSLPSLTRQCGRPFVLSSIFVCSSIHLPSICCVLGPNHDYVLLGDAFKKQRQSHHILEIAPLRWAILLNTPITRGRITEETWPPLELTETAERLCRTVGGARLR